MKRGDKGPKIQELQEILIELGFDLVRWGADGDLGTETLEAFEAFLMKYSLERIDVDPNVITDEELAYLYLVQDRLRSKQVPPPQNLVDRRAYTGTNKDYGPRTWLETYGICLHQTACHLGASKRLDRCDKIGAHFVVYQTGAVFWLHDQDRIIEHGHGWNAHTIGIEIDGLFEGVLGEPSTLWNDPDTPYVDKAMRPTTAQIEATKQLIRWNCDFIRKRGGRIRSLVAHRQSSATRPNDPGSESWQEISIPMQRELGLSSGALGFKIGTGRPIPESWDSSKKGVKY